jgi:hypothetical protein
MRNAFELYLFAVDPELVAHADHAGVDGFVVDWEVEGKSHRQRNADTGISQHTNEDLRRVRAATRRHVICRLNQCGPTTERELEMACDGGADEVLLPMVRSVRQVSEVLDQVNSRIPVGILVETAAAVSIADHLAELPLSRVFLGLNDLAIDRATPLFDAVADGTVERVRTAFGERPFGFGGLTHPEYGSPIPCRLLLSEMIRLHCQYSFLRRSFLRDVPAASFPEAIAAIRGATAAAYDRTPIMVQSDRDALQARLLQGRVV